jgi:hypothetical protein
MEAGRLGDLETWRLGERDINNNRTIERWNPGTLELWNSGTLEQ